MPTTAIDVIDSAVKIGLGALISALAGYAVAKASHRNDREKNLRENKIKNIEFIAERYESYFQSYVSFLNRINGIKKKTGATEEVKLDPVQKRYLKEKDPALLESHNNLFAVRSRLMLLDSESTITHLESASNIISDIRNKVFMENCLPSDEYIKSKMTSLKEARTSIEKGLRNIYKNL